ncbi:hypothetical protein TNCV_5096751 [Trichonephila clavipes]|nr:hypothetical protein TNCV_5096751 [Trichonephila clavipes]
MCRLPIYGIICLSKHSRMNCEKPILSSFDRDPLGNLWGQNGISFQPTQEENVIMQIRNCVYTGSLVFACSKSPESSMRRSNSASEVPKEC